MPLTELKNITEEIDYFDENKKDLSTPESVKGWLIYN